MAKRGRKGPDDMTKQELVESYKEYLEKYHNQSRELSTVRTTLRLVRENRAKLFLKYQQKIAELLAAKVEDISIKNIPIASHDYRMLLLNLEAVSTKNSKEQRTKAIKDAQEMCFKKDLHDLKMKSGGKAPRAYGSRKAPEREDMDELSGFESEFLEGVEDAEGIKGSQGIQSFTVGRKEQSDGSEDSAITDGTIPQDWEEEPVEEGEIEKMIEGGFVDEDESIDDGHNERKPKPPPTRSRQEDVEIERHEMEEIDKFFQSR